MITKSSRKNEQYSTKKTYKSDDEVCCVLCLYIGNPKWWKYIWKASTFLRRLHSWIREWAKIHIWIFCFMCWLLAYLYVCAYKIFVASTHTWWASKNGTKEKKSGWKRVELMASCTVKQYHVCESYMRCGCAEIPKHNQNKVQKKNTHSCHKNSNTQKKTERNKPTKHILTSFIKCAVSIFIFHT